MHVAFWFLGPAETALCGVSSSEAWTAAPPLCVVH